MTETVPAPVVASTKASKKSTPQKNRTGPTLSEHILKAVSDSKERKGVSVPAIKAILKDNGYNVEKNKNRFRTTLKNLVDNGSLVQVKGSGASGSFKIGKKTEAKKPPQRKAVATIKKPIAKKVASKKTTQKKSPVKKSKTSAKKQVSIKKSPAKKSNKPIKKITPKKSKPAKKTQKKSTKSTTKKTAAKKK